MFEFLIKALLQHLWMQILQCNLVAARGKKSATYRKPNCRRMQGFPCPSSAKAVKFKLPMRASPSSVDNRWRSSPGGERWEVIGFDNWVRGSVNSSCPLSWAQSRHKTSPNLSPTLARGWKTSKRMARAEFTMGLPKMLGTLRRGHGWKYPQGAP